MTKDSGTNSQSAQPPTRTRRAASSLSRTRVPVVPRNTSISPVAASRTCTTTGSDPPAGAVPAPRAGPAAKRLLAAADSAPPASAAAAAPFRSERRERPGGSSSRSSDGRPASLVPGIYSPFRRRRRPLNPLRTSRPCYLEKIAGLPQRRMEIAALTLAAPYLPPQAFLRNSPPPESMAFNWHRNLPSGRVCQLIGVTGFLIYVRRICQVSAQLSFSAVTDGSRRAVDSPIAAMRGGPGSRAQGTDILRGAFHAGQANARGLGLLAGRGYPPPGSLRKNYSHSASAASLDL